MDPGGFTPSSSPDHIPAQDHKLLLRTHMKTGTSNGGTSNTPYFETSDLAMQPGKASLQVGTKAQF
jgi:hypothetical protein